MSDADGDAQLKNRSETGTGFKRRITRDMDSADLTEAQIEYEQDRLIDLLGEIGSLGTKFSLAKSRLDSALADLNEHVADATRRGCADADLTALLESAETEAREVKGHAVKLLGYIIGANGVVSVIRRRNER